MDEIRILILEDFPADAELAVRTLQRDGMSFEWKIVQTGEAYLEALGSFDPSLIISDFRLPDLDGMKAIALARKKRPETPIVMYTGSIDEETAVACLKAGASDYVLKSHLKRLPSACRTALASARSREEARRAESALRESEMRFRTLVETANDAIVSADETGRIIFWNPGAGSTFGYSEEEALGRRLTDLMPERFREAHLAAFQRQVSANQPEELGDTVQLVGLRRDGTEFPLEVSLAGWKSNGHHRFNAIMRDISERAAAEEVIESLSRKYETLLNSAGEGIIGMDRQGACTFVNPAALGLILQSRNEILGKDIHTFIHHSHADGSPAPAEECPVLEAVRDGTSLRGETTYWRGNGEPFPVAFSCTPITQNDEIDGAVLIFEDTTERKHLEEQLRQAQKMEAVGQLTGGIAHDFNNELSVIMLNAELMASDLKAGSAFDEEDLQAIHDAAQRATRMTRQLLSFSRQAELRVDSVDLSAVAQNLSGMLGSVLPESIRVRVESSGTVRPVLVDEGAVEQIVLNLATNARDAMPHGGDLVIRVSEEEVDEERSVLQPGFSPGSYVYLEVSDNGTGMDSATLARVFEPFFTTKPPGEGTGLGLAMVYGLTKQQDGYVHLCSEVGMGTTVRVYFPQAAGRTGAGRVELSLDAPSGGTETILLAEDEPAVRAATRRALERNGYRVITAVDGEDGLRLFREHTGAVDLVISDLVMPNLSGSQMFEQIREEAPNLPFILASGYTGRDAVERDMVDPSIPFVQKPWNLRDLLATVRSALDRGA